MEFDETVGILLLVGVVTVALATVVVAPASHQPYVTEVDSDVDPPAQANVTDYETLSPSSQQVVDEAIRDGYTKLSTGSDSEAIESLRGDRFVRKDGTVYFLRTTSADGDGGFFQLIVGNAFLAMGGLLVGAAAYWSTGGRRYRSVALFPVCAAASLLAGTVLAGAGSPDDLLFVLSLGFAATVPVIFGIAARQRAFPLGVGALVLLVVTVTVLFLAPESFALPILMGLVVLGVPGAGLGWWVAGNPRDE